MPVKTIVIDNDSRVPAGTKFQVNLPDKFTDDDVHNVVEQQIATSKAVQEQQARSSRAVQPVGYTGDPGRTPPAPTESTGLLGKIKGWMGDSKPVSWFGRDPTGRIPILSDAVDTASRAFHAPISADTKSNKTADILETGATLLGGGMAPKIGASIATHPVRAALTAIPAMAAQQGTEAITGNRLAGDLAGGVVGAAEGISPKVNAATGGAVKGLLKSTFMPSAMKYGVPVPPVIAGGAIGEILGGGFGHREAGAVVGGLAAGAEGMVKGAREAAVDKPWLPTKTVSRAAPAWESIKPDNPVAAKETPISKPVEFPSGRKVGGTKPVEAPKPKETISVNKAKETKAPDAVSKSEEAKRSEQPKETKDAQSEGSNVITPEDKARYEKLAVTDDKHAARMFHQAFQRKEFSTADRRSFTQENYGKESSNDLSTHEKLHAIEKVLGVKLDNDYIGKAFPTKYGLTPKKAPKE